MVVHKYSFVCFYLSVLLLQYNQTSRSRKPQSSRELQPRKRILAMASNGDFGGHVCGCHYTSGTTYHIQRHYLPQVQLDSHTTLTPLYFTTKLTQVFHNPNTTALKQVRYTFPLYDGVAVNSYTISYASKTLTGVVKQKDDARQTYQAAVDRGESAGLLESLPAGVFGVTLGNVPAGEDVKVQVTYCGELKHDAGIDGLRFTLPTAIAPRYGDYPGEVLKSDAVVKKGMSITVDVDMLGQRIRRVQSPGHAIAVSMGSTSSCADKDAFEPDKASATLTQGSTELAADFILQLLVDDISTPRAVLETHPTLPNQRALMATLVPKFTLPAANPEIVFIADQSYSMHGAKNAALVTALKVFLKSLPLGVRFNLCAFWDSYKFLWPKSKVYTEASVNAAMAFVQTFQGNRSGTEILGPIKAAFERRLGDLPLEVMLLTDGEIWNEDDVFGYLNEQIVEKAVEARVFALGIGTDVSHTLVEGVARAGRGFAQFVTEREEGQAEGKVVRMLKGALYGHTKDYQLEAAYGGEEGDGNEAMRDEDDGFEIVEKVNECLNIQDKPPAYETKSSTATSGEEKSKSFFDTSADLDKPLANDKTDRYAHLPVIDTPKLLQAPSTIPPLFPFNRTTIYLLLGPETAQKKVHSIILRATSAEGPLELSIPVSTVPALGGVPTLHQLAARKAIQDLEEGRGWLQTATIQGDESRAQLVKKKYESRFDELVEREGVRLGQKFQVASKWTSFVAVEDGKEMEVEKDRAEVRAGGTNQAQKRGMWLSAAPPSSASLGRFLGAQAAPRAPSGAQSARGVSYGAPARGTLASMQSSGAPRSSAPGSYGMASAPTASLRSAPALPAPQAFALSSPPPQFEMAEAAGEEEGEDEEEDEGMEGEREGMEEGEEEVEGNIELQHPIRDARVERRAMLGGHEELAHDRQPQHPPTRTKTEAMHRLISMQTFSGSWMWTKELAGVLGLADQPAVSADPGARATVLVMAWLVKHVPEKKDVWEMVVAKAKAWLCQRMSMDEEDVEKIVTKADQYV